MKRLRPGDIVYSLQRTDGRECPYRVIGETQFGYIQIQCIASWVSYIQIQCIASWVSSRPHFTVKEHTLTLGNSFMDALRDAYIASGKVLPGVPDSRKIAETSLDTEGPQL